MRYTNGGPLNQLDYLGPNFGNVWNISKMFGIFGISEIFLNILEYVGTCTRNIEVVLP